MFRRFLFKNLTCLVFLAGAHTAFAQLPFSLGIKAGVGLTDALQDKSTLSGSSLIRSFSDSKDYIIGPFAELRLPAGLGVEADALYRPLSSATSVQGSLLGSGTTSGRFGSWEFPIVGKYRFQFPVVHPYIEAGPSFRTTGNASSLSGKGFVLGAGIEAHLLLIRVSPEFRYTRWGSDSGAPPVVGLRSNQNQAEFLVGFSF